MATIAMSIAPMAKTEQTPKKMLKVITKDEQIISIERDIWLKCCILLKNVCEDFDEEMFETEPIPISNADLTTFEIVNAWVERHRDDPDCTNDAADDSPKSCKVGPDDAKFMQALAQDTLFDVILAANFLDIKPLLDCCCKTIANMIRGRTPQEIRELFGIVNDFTQEEEEHIRRENEWAEDR